MEQMQQKQMLHREEAGRMGQVIQTRFIGFYSRSTLQFTWRMLQ